MSSFLDKMTPEEISELKERHDKVVKEVKEEEALSNKIKLMRIITNPETYADIALERIADNPESFNPSVMKDILVDVIATAMDVWSHNGHLIFLDKDNKNRCLHCGKSFSEELPRTKLCRVKTKRGKHD